MMGCYAVIVDNLVHGRTSKLKPNVKQKSVRIIVTLIVQCCGALCPSTCCQLVLLLKDPSVVANSRTASITSPLLTLPRSVRRKSRRTTRRSTRSASNMNMI
ncbi:unnamed protein product [Boreogadus saida]